MDRDIQLGDEVIIGEEFNGIVDEIIFVRGRPEPLILVEWWRDGDLVTRRFLLEDLKKITPESGQK